MVLLFTDGLEREGTPELQREMERLHKSCRRLIWLNPLLRYDRFEARAQGIRAMLPHVDEFRPIHNLSSMEALVEALSGEVRRCCHRPASLAQTRGLKDAAAISFHAGLPVKVGGLACIDAARSRALVGRA